MKIKCEIARKVNLVLGVGMLVFALVGAILVLIGKASDPTYILLLTAIALGLGIYLSHQAKKTVVCSK